MIHEIGLELQKQLRARGCPLEVVDGPERTKTTSWTKQRIVLEDDDGGADAFAPVRSQHINPKLRYTVNQACKLTIYAKSERSGAMLFEHRRVAKAARDMVLCALDLIASRRKNAWKAGGGRFITPVDLQESEQPGGAVYELKFTFERGVKDVTWAGRPTPEATLTALQNTTKVSRANALDDNDPLTIPADAETACGA